MNHFGDKIAQSNLWQILMPEEQYGKTFDKLFKFLLDKGLVTLGLYRLTGAQDNFTHPYVFTNPGQKTIVTPKDRVFVIGRTSPRISSLTPPRRGIKNSSETTTSLQIKASSSGRVWTRRVQTSHRASTEISMGLGSPFQQRPKQVQCNCRRTKVPLQM